VLQQVLLYNPPATITLTEHHTLATSNIPHESLTNLPACLLMLL
jgi:hypothetical protein